MSILNQLFSRGILGPKCKTCLNLAISRIKLLQNKRDMQLKLMRKEIGQFLQAGQEPIARIRVEHVIREENIWNAYEILEMFCEFVLARVPILESQRECPIELREAVASIIFAAPRCSDLPDLLQIRNLFVAKYGKEFIAAASELRPDTSVNRTIVEKLSVSTPSADVRLKVLKNIAREHKVEWDSSKTEEEFKKRPEDLLNGPRQVSSDTSFSHLPSPPETLGQPPPIVAAQKKQAPQVHQPPSPAKTVSSSSKSEINSLSTNNYVTRDIDMTRETRPQSSDALERARAAIAAAERATAAARAAALLVNVKFGSHIIESQSS